MTAEEGNTQREGESIQLPPFETLFQERTLKKIAKDPNMQAAFERLGTEEGLRELARERTKYMIGYMSDQSKYQAGNWYRFDGLLNQEVGGRSVIDPNSLWNQLDYQRREIALREIGATLGVDYLYEQAQALKAQVDAEETPAEKISVSLPTNNSAFRVQIIYQNGELKYQILKVQDTPKE